MDMLTTLYIYRGELRSFYYEMGALNFAIAAPMQLEASWLRTQACFEANVKRKVLLVWELSLLRGKGIVTQALY